MRLSCLDFKIVKFAADGGSFEKMLDERPSRDAASLRTAPRLSVTVPLFAPTALFPPLTMAMNVWSAARFAFSHRDCTAGRVSRTFTA